jgi:hypothetical protein
VRLFALRTKACWQSRDPSFDSSSAKPSMLSSRSEQRTTVEQPQRFELMDNKINYHVLGENMISEETVPTGFEPVT